MGRYVRHEQGSPLLRSGVGKALVERDVTREGRRQVDGGRGEYTPTCKYLALTDLALGARCIGHLLGDDLEVDAAEEVHLAGVDAHDVYPRCQSGVRELDLSVDSSRPKQRGVQDIDPVRRHDHLGRHSSPTRPRGQ